MGDGPVPPLDPPRQRRPARAGGVRSGPHAAPRSLIVATNGAPWFMSGVPDERWDNDVLATLRRLHGSDFELDTSTLMVHPDSGAARR